jgi:hypothetical protein
MCIAFQDLLTFLGLVNQSFLTSLTCKNGKKRDPWNDHHYIQVPGDHSKEAEGEASS